MGQRIVALALTGWALIVFIAWRMANARIELCYFADEACKIRTTAARDYVLVAGLTVALAFAILAMIVVAIARVRAGQSSWTPSANRAELPRLR